MSRKGFRPEEEFLSPFFFDDVQLVVVPQSTGHLLIRHIVSVLLYDIKCLTPDTGSFFFFLCSSPWVLVYVCEASFTNRAAHLVVSPETCQPIWIHHSEHMVLPVFPSDVFLVTFITQQLVHVVPQQSALWSRK